MATVAFLKGINVGGHRRFRPTVLAGRLRRFEVVNVGSTGTFVVHKPVSGSDLRAEITSRIPFEVEVMVCNGREIRRLVSENPFTNHHAGRDVVRFVGIMAKRKRVAATFPLALPAKNGWYVKVLGYRDRFVLGLYRRRMKTIGCLGQLEKLVGAPLAIRNWNTILAVEEALRT
jgi:uncharacterized protein (DUF1697 family)